MSFSPPQASQAFNKTRLRTPDAVSPFSGMCSLCTADCPGLCEIALAAARGKDIVYPTTTGDNQVASEKNYPIDYSHFNINGRVFGAQGAALDAEKTTVHHVDLSTTIGRNKPIKMTMPIILPALIKLNWQDYFAGAAMAGVICTIGEGAITKDPDLQFENGKVSKALKLKEMLGCFYDNYRGYGEIFLQVNYDDDMQGVPEYALVHCGAKAIEFKFGQSAKGTQPVNAVKNLDEALKKKMQGYLVLPDPTDPAVQAAWRNGAGDNFRTYGRAPIWSDEHLVKRIDELRRLGAEHIAFKMAGFDPDDIEHVLRIAAAAKVDLVTFDGAGGGSGYSPSKMMNEWGLPTVALESVLYEILKELHAEGLALPSVALTGGFTAEDNVYKALALGMPYISAVGLCRAAMAAANTGKNIGDALEKGTPLPPSLSGMGATKEELFRELPQLRAIYGEKANGFSAGAIGVYSFLSKVAFGLQHFMMLNRKFAMQYVNRRDVIPLTRDALDILYGRWMEY